MATIEEQVKQIISTQLGVRLTEMRNNSYFISDLGADDLDVKELMRAFEEAFGFEIPDYEAEKIKDVQSAVDFFSMQQS